MADEVVTSKPVDIDRLANELGAPVGAIGADPHVPEPTRYLANVEPGKLVAALDAHDPTTAPPPLPAAKNIAFAAPTPAIVEPPAPSFKHLKAHQYLIGAGIAGGLVVVGRFLP